MRIHARSAVAVCACLALPLLAACGSSGSDVGSGGQGDASGTAGTAGGTGVAGGDQALTVYAAASLNKTFTQLGKEFEQQHPGVRVSFSFGGSSDLVAQLTQGAPGDVFASADQKNMDKAVTAGIVSGQPTPFASNTLTIVTAPGNPKKITDLRNLAQQSTGDVKAVVCAAPVPCGAATDKVEKAAGVTIKAVSEEQAVTDVLGKVTSGQADAGLVYVTDAKGAGDKVTQVDFPESSTAVNRYPIAALSSAKNPTTATQFVDFIAGERGRAVLSEAGFAAP